MSIVQDKCGIVVAHTLHDAFAMADILQHRGKEAAGFAGVSDGRIDVVRYRGKVRDGTFDRQGLHAVFDSMHPQGASAYHTYMGMVRYATRGEDDPNSLLLDAGPAVIGGRSEHTGPYITIQDCDAALVMNGQVDETLLPLPKNRQPLTDSDTERLLHYYATDGIHNLLQSVPGAYTLAIADKHHRGVIVARDRTGIRPGVLGQKEGKHIVASEDIALGGNGASVIEHLEPGAIYRIHPNGRYDMKPVVDPREAHCFFEWSYISGVDSVVDGVAVRAVRSALGRALAHEFPSQQTDITTYLPRCPRPAAQAFARETGTDFLEVFTKASGDRAFMDTTADARQQAIRSNLFLLPNIAERIRGRTVVLIDDSIVRGNNIRPALDLLENAGVQHVRVLSYTPPIGVIGKDGKPRGCSFGVDMPPNDSFFIRTEEGDRNRTDDELAAAIRQNGNGREYNMDVEVRYLSGRGMKQVFDEFGMKKKRLCTHCIGGEHPFDGLVELTTSAT